MASTEPIYVITHIDFMRPHLEAGRTVIEEYAAATRKRPDVVRFELLRQIHRENHFELLTVFTSIEAYEDNLTSETTLEFRRRLHPMLGSPWDDRLHYLHES